MADNRNFVNKFANQGGGDIFVEDAKLSEITTKSAIASEGVILKGTDGAYYEIDKTSLSEVIRAELGAILADNSKNNGTSVGKVPTLNSSGNALGASSVADLASVLGGNVNWISSAYDGYTTQGVYWVGNDLVEVFGPSSDSRIIQRISSTSSNGEVSVVCRVYVGGAWKNVAVMSFKWRQ